MTMNYAPRLRLSAAIFAIALASIASPRILAAQGAGWTSWFSIGNSVSVSFKQVSSDIWTWKFRNDASRALTYLEFEYTDRKGDHRDVHPGSLGPGKVMGGWAAFTATGKPSRIRILKVKYAGDATAGSSGSSAAERERQIAERAAERQRQLDADAAERMRVAQAQAEAMRERFRQEEAERVARQAEAQRKLDAQRAADERRLREQEEAYRRQREETQRVRDEIAARNAETQRKTDAITSAGQQLTDLLTSEARRKSSQRAQQQRDREESDRQERAEREEQEEIEREERMAELDRMREVRLRAQRESEAAFRNAQAASAAAAAQRAADPTLAKIQISSNPAGAEISMSNHNLGTAPWNGTAGAGMWRVTARRGEWSKTVDVNLVQGGSASVHFEVPADTLPHPQVASPADVAARLGIYQDWQSRVGPPQRPIAPLPSSAFGRKGAIKGGLLGLILGGGLAFLATSQDTTEVAYIAAPIMTVATMFGGMWLGNEMGKDKDARLTLLNQDQHRARVIMHEAAMVEWRANSERERIAVIQADERVVQEYRALENERARIIQQNHAIRARNAALPEPQIR
jgi:hypothetical protein